MLCRHCDANEPAATPLIAMFTVYDQVTDENVAECGAMLQPWVDALMNRRVSAHEQAEEEARYPRGEM